MSLTNLCPKMIQELNQLCSETPPPFAAYKVSGEYADIKFAALTSDERKDMFKTLTGFKRAGAELIVTDYAKQIAQWLAGQNSEFK